MNYMPKGMEIIPPAAPVAEQIRFGDLVHAVLPFMQLQGPRLCQDFRELRQFLRSTLSIPKKSPLLSPGWAKRIMQCWDYVAEIIDECDIYYLEPLFLGRLCSDLLVYHEVNRAYVIEFKTRQIEGPEENRVLSANKSREQVLQNTKRLRKIDPDCHIFGYVLWFEYSTKDPDFGMTPVWELVVEYPAPH